MPFQPPPPQRMIERIRSRIYEGATLTSYDYRNVIVPIYTPLSSAANRGNAVFRIPFNQEFRVQQIIPHVVPDVVDLLGGPNNGQLQSFAAATYSVEDLATMLAMNCRADIKIVSGRQMLFSQKGLALSDLAQNPIRFFDVPLLLPAGTSVEVILSLQDTAAVAALSAVEYGVNLVGAYVRNT
jgi:hypothetical protein